MFKFLTRIDLSFDLSRLSLYICLLGTKYFYSVCSTRVSNELGANNPNAAKSAMYTVMGISAVQISILSTCILLLGNLWARAFSNVEEVTEYTSSAMPLLAVTYLFDGIQGVLSG